MNYPELAQSERRRLWGRLFIRIALIILVALFVFLLVPSLFSHFYPFIMAFVIAWIFHPLIQKIQKRLRISRKLLSFIFTMLLFVVAGGLITLLVVSIGREIISFVQSWMESGVGIADTITSSGLVADILSALPGDMSAAVESAIVSVVEWVKTALTSLLSTLTSKAGSLISSVPRFFLSIVVFLTALYFISADYPTLRTSISNKFTGELRKFMGFLRNSALAAFGSYLRAQLLLSLGVFFILLIGFFIIQQSYALLLAFLFAILDFIPLIGSGTVMVPWAVIALLSGNYVLAIQLMAIWGVVVVYRRLLEPKIVGSQTGLSPLLSLISIYIGMRLFNVWGMILGPVILQICISVYKSGLFNGLVADIKLFVKDCVAVLRNKPDVQENVDN